MEIHIGTWAFAAIMIFFLIIVLMVSRDYRQIRRGLETLIETLSEEHRKKREETLSNLSQRMDAILEKDSGPLLYSELFKIYQSEGHVVLTGFNCLNDTNNWTVVVDFQDTFARFFTIQLAKDGKLSITSSFHDCVYAKTTLREFLRGLSRQYDVDFGYSEFHSKGRNFIEEFVDNFGERFAGGVEAYRNQDISERIETEIYDEFVDGE